MSLSSPLIIIFRWCLPSGGCPKCYSCYWSCMSPCQERNHQVCVQIVLKDEVLTVINISEIFSTVWNNLHKIFWMNLLIWQMLCGRRWWGCKFSMGDAYAYVSNCQWTSYQIRKIAGCACTGNTGNVFPTTDFKGNRRLAIPACITARA